MTQMYDCCLCAFDWYLWFNAHEVISHSHITYSKNMHYPHMYTCREDHKLHAQSLYYIIAAEWERYYPSVENFAQLFPYKLQQSPTLFAFLFLLCPRVTNFFVIPT